ncbi:MAG: histidinol-phosphate transaminase [Deltaproteobacteria bacterium]|nr:histidinol-phosphate transaminase [Deltaproteobacteria bacterium]
MHLLSHVPQYIKDLVPYPPGKPVDEVEREYGISGSVKLASNECPLGPSPKALEAAKKVLKSIHIYPDGGGYYLKKRLSEKHDVNSENIILGNGSNEIIELICRAFIRKGDEAIMGDPAFIVYQSITRATGAQPVPVPLTGYVHDLKGMAAKVTEKTRVVFIANPNNPTGTIVDRNELESFINSVPENILIVMDEAYCEYAETFPDYGESLGYVKERQNVIVLRTFSKAFGLAGLRIGYGVASREIISILERVRQPFNVNSIALAAAQAAVDDEEHLKRSLQVNGEGMAYLTSMLHNMGVSYVESYANFLLIDTGKDSDVFCERLLKKGVIVRSMSGYGLESHIRVTVGLMEENKKFITGFRDCI